MGELGFCTLADIIKKVQDQLLTDLAIDGNTPYLLSRFLHNKFFSYPFHTLHCYTQYFDIKQISLIVPFVFIPFILLAFFNRKMRKSILISLALLPLFFILNPFHLNLQIKIILFQVYYVLVAVVGIISLFTGILKSYSNKRL